MAVVYNTEQPPNKDIYVSDGSGLIRALKWPAGLSIKERARLYKLGKKDARSHKTFINGYNEIASMNCESLVQETNQRIELEWQQCNEICFKACGQIDKINAKKRKIRNQLQDVILKRDMALDALSKSHYDGDDVVSEHLAERRQQRRRKQTIDPLDAQISSFEAQLEDLDIASIPYQNMFVEAEEAARCNEQLARTDFLWRLSVYAYGASNYIKITPDMIHANYLSSAAQEMHDKIFKDRSSGFNDGNNENNNNNIDNNNGSSGTNNTSNNNEDEEGIQGNNDM